MDVRRDGYSYLTVKEADRRGLWTEWTHLEVDNAAGISIAGEWSCPVTRSRAGTDRCALEEIAFEDP